MEMQINLHVSEVNAAIALFSGAAEKIRAQAEAQAQAAMMAQQAPAVPAPPAEEFPDHPLSEGGTD